MSHKPSQIYSCKYSFVCTPSRPPARLDLLMETNAELPPETVQLLLRKALPGRIVEDSGGAHYHRSEMQEQKGLK